MSNFAKKHAEGPKHLTVAWHDWIRPGGAESTLYSKGSKLGPSRVRVNVRDEDRLPKVNCYSARCLIGTDARSIRPCPICLGQVRSGAISQVLTVLLKQENRTQHSLTVGFNQAADSRQNLVQGCTDKHHLQRIKDRLTR